MRCDAYKLLLSLLQEELDEAESVKICMSHMLNCFLKWRVLVIQGVSFFCILKRFVVLHCMCYPSVSQSSLEDHLSVSMLLCAFCCLHHGRHY